MDPDHAGAGGHSLAARREAFGDNRFKEVPVQPFWRLLVDNLSDPTLILLMCAAAVRPRCRLRRLSIPPRRHALGIWQRSSAV